MLVQLSPWETTTTSFGTSGPKRRRKGGDSNSNDNDKDEKPLLYAASVVASSKRFRGRRRKEEELVPLLAITSSHRVSVVGRASSLLQESTRWQYASRPGSATSFLDHKEKNHTRIGAVLDTRNQRFYALQNSNKLVCAWDAESSPDEACTMELPMPAVSLSSLPQQQGIAYGTLQDGSLFFGRWQEGDTKQLQLSTVELEGIQGAKHLCTFLKESISISIGKKRKATETAGGPVLYQVFSVDKRSVVVRRHELNLGDPCVLRKTETCRVDLEGTAQLSFLTCQIVGTTVVMVFKDKTSPYKCATLSLETGKLVGEPFVLPLTTHGVCPLSADLILVATMDQITIYRQGIHVDSISVANVVLDSKEWNLTVELRTATLMVLSSHANKVQVSVARLLNYGQTPKLGAGLRSALAAQTAVFPDLMASDTTCNLSDVLDSKATTKKKKKKRNSLESALRSLRGCVGEILNPKGGPFPRGRLLDLYRSCLDTVSDKEHENGENGKNGVKNGKSHDTNGSKATSNPLKNLPQDFVDVATSVVVSILLLPKVEDDAVGQRVALARQDARLILCQLIESGRVSARHHLESPGESHVFLSILASMRTASGEAATSCQVTPVDLIHSVLSHCSDITERQMVAMIRYMFCYATPQDIAQQFLSCSFIREDDPHCQISRSFGRAKASLANLQRGSPKPGKKAKAQATEELDMETTKLIRAGAQFVVERIIGYSACNLSLLRHALAQGLPGATESLILTRLILDLELSIPTRTTKKRRIDRTRLHQWLYAVCEAFHGTLVTKDNVNDDSILESITKQINLVQEQTEVLLQIKAMVDASSAHKPSAETVAPPKLAPYTVERLRF